MICCGMRCSGSTLLYQLAERLVEDTGRGQGIGATEDYESLAHLNAAHAHRRGWLVVKTHEFTHDWRGVLEQGSHGLYVYRNLYDVLVSETMNNVALSLDDPDSLRAHAAWLVEQHRQWMAMPATLVLTYADLVGDIAGSVMRIAAHLGIRISQRWGLHLAWAFSISQQKARTNGAAWSIRERIRDGRVGMWRDHVTPEQADRLLDIVGTVDVPELKL